MELEGVVLSSNRHGDTSSLAEVYPCLHHSINLMSTYSQLQ